MAENHPKTIGQYDIIRKLGKGGMGTVYEGRQPSLDRRVAIKVLPRDSLGDEKAVERFGREAQAVAMLSHPNIVQIIDKSQDDDLLYFVMEYVEGSSLEALLGRRQLSLQEIFGVFKSVCRAIEYAHSKSVVHRDINPRNILVSGDLAVVKVVDFGISRVESISLDQGTLSTMAASMGTLHYIAPEQAANMLDSDHRADIYSLGVLLYSMLTGKVPVGSFNLPSRINTDVPPEMDPVVMKCLATDPKDRFQSVGQLLKDLKKLEEKLHFRLVNELKGISRSTGNILRLSTQSITRKRRNLTAAGIIVLVLIASLVVWRTWPADPEADPTELAQEPASADNATPAQAAAGEKRDADSKKPARQSATRKSPPPAPTSQPSQAATPIQPTGGDGSGLDVDLRIADEKRSAGLHEQALGDVEAMLETYADNPEVSEAYLLRGLIQQDLNKAQDAMASYLEVGTRFPQSPHAPEAKFRLAQLTLKERRGAELQVRTWLEELARDYPTSDWTPRALSLKATIEKDKKVHEVDPVIGTRVPSELITYRTLTERFPRHKEAENAFWILGELYEDMKRWEPAAEAFLRLADNFPQTRRDALWKAGQIFERRLKDKDRAREAYTRIPQGSRRHKDAQKRLQRLSR